MTVVSRDAPAIGALDRLPRFLREHGGDRPVQLFVDTGLLDSPIHRAVRSLIGRPHPYATHVVEGETSLDDVDGAARQLPADAQVVGVGGGMVMDRVKLLALVGSDPACARTLALATGQRPGFVMLSERARRRMPLIMIPTTVGTGAEASRTACLRLGQGKRLVYGAALRPDAAVIDPLATESLPSWLLTEGALEAVIRVLSYYVGHHGERQRSDRRAEELLVELVRLGYDIVRRVADGHPVPAPVRFRIATLSGRTHRDEMHEGLTPFSDKCWPLANELSMAAGCRKLTALAVVAPVLWRRVTAGGTCWGSATRLARIWLAVRSVVPELDEDPAQGFVGLMDDWGIGRTITRPDADDLARDTAKAWALGLPMLNGVTQEELRSVFDEALSRPGDTVSRLREEVNQ